MSDRNFSAKSIGKYILSKIHILLWPIPLVLMMEFLNRDSVYKALGYGYKHMNEMFLNYLIILALFFLFIAILGRTQLAFWVVSTPIMILSLISGVKRQILGVPLLPWDVFLTNETEDITKELGDLIPWKMIIGIIIFVVIAIILLNKVKLLRGKFNWTEKIVLLVLSVFMLFTIYTDKPIKIKDALSISTIPWDQADNYLRNGFALTTMMNMDLIFVKKPDGYNEANIAAMVKDTERRTNTGSKEKPNVIVVLSESLFDATKLPNVKFSEEPMPHLRSLQQKYPHGEMLSPQFGGGTANVEFEVLSGNSMRFLPQGSLAYIQYVNHPTDSIAGILSRKGYNTAAINPYHNWFFNSKNVYHNFGFSKFISTEFFEPEYKGNYLSDHAVAKKIIEEADKSDGPDMIFANTMENHAPYESNKFASNPISVSGNMSPESKAMLETYATGMRDADLMLKEITDHFEKKGEPTIVLFFGDHLPSLGNDYQVYRDVGYLLPNDPDVTKKLFSTPFVIWDNYLPEHREELYMSPSFLSPYILNMANLEGTFYTDYLYNLMKKHPVIPPKNMYEAMNIKEEDLKGYEMLQYDGMFGNQFNYGDYRDKILAKNFMLGLGEMKIEDASVQQVGGTQTLVISGKNLSPTGVIYANDTALETTYSNGKLMAPYSSLAGKDNIKIQIRVIDTKNITIAASNNMDLGQQAVPASN
ncbi:LTA synthase family protein [Paenibacillus sp. N1-5-1-14]|uniref:LTA synthase family protein n=1 Tax=Paenibacillus radicibacter TaxID=2972488 RepID=UPI002158CF7A|nr:LTA synthase family protein [Paenibacillus radicibacter]MCR8642467.1 LTA synthase family protein [Paenibacillus radicibacter]